jgi:RHS repeat-associated protein
VGWLCLILVEELSTRCGSITLRCLDSRATTATANQTYAYTVSDSSVSGVVSSKMNVSAALVPTVTIDDSLGRTRQTQTETPQGGRLISDTFYDSHGWVIKTNTDYWDSTTLPTLALVPVADNQVPDQDDYTFDGLGRAVEDQSEDDAVVKSTSYTVYSGDATTSIPPTGAVAETTVTDPLGRTSALLEYTAAPTLTIPSNTFTGIWYITAAAGTYTTTGYGYDGHGNQASITDTAGDTWTSTFNLLGQVTTKADPDAGNSIVTYDADGNVLSSTDERRDTVSYTYDALGRETAEYGATTAGQAPANELASWVYDGSASLYEVGQLVSATSYIGGTSGSAYTEATTGYNVFGESKGTTVTIPSSEGALAGAYTTTHTYATTTGLLAKDTYTAVDGLPAETVVHSYTSALDLPGEVGSYGGATDYSAYSQVLQQTLGNGTYGEAYVSDTYDAHTGDLTDQLVTRSLDTPADVDETAYIYDASGNITHQTETRLGSSSDTETQCYQYDALDQLTAAWSATDGCAVPPTSSSYSQVANTLGTNSAYWTSWTFNALGERTGQTQHSLSSGTADTVTSYAYNGNGAGQANTLTSTATTGGTAGSTSYAYDADGNATTRDTAGGSQTLTWNTAGQLATVTGASTGTSYVYDASGSVLLRKDTGTTTLYLPDEELVLNTSTNAVSGTRYYQLPGGGEAVRTGTGTNYGFALTDQHGTADLELDYTAQTPTWRQFDPYGNPRGTAVTWIDGHGFLDASQDATTGLTDIGAREYDPVTGTFISLDPVLEMVILSLRRIPAGCGRCVWVARSVGSPVRRICSGRGLRRGLWVTVVSLSVRRRLLPTRRPRRWLLIRRRRRRSWLLWRSFRRLLLSRGMWRRLRRRTTVVVFSLLMVVRGCFLGWGLVRGRLRISRRVVRRWGGRVWWGWCSRCCRSGRSPRRWVSRGLSRLRVRRFLMRFRGCPMLLRARLRVLRVLRGSSAGS